VLLVDDYYSLLCCYYYHFVIIYYDDEGDMIKLTCQPELDEALNFAKNNGDFLPIVIETLPAIKEEEPKEEKENIPNPLDFIAKFVSNAEAPFNDVVNTIVNNSEDLISAFNSDSIEKAAQNFQQYFNPQDIEEEKKRSCC